MNRALIIAYCSSFTSFLLRLKAEKISKIILFGSVARDQHDKESDIDIFIETKEDPDSIRKVLNLYYQSEDAKKFKFLGVDLPISLHIGDLDKRVDLKRSMLGNGIVLYSQFHESPEGEMFAIFSLKTPKLSPKNKLKFWRRLYGHAQKVGNKKYESESLLAQLNGVKLGKGVFIIPFQNVKKIKDYLQKQKIRYTIAEIWSDSPMLSKRP